MAWWDWLFGENRDPREEVTLPDRIWLTERAKRDGLRAEIADRLRGVDPPTAVILAAHFEDELPPLREIAEREEFTGQPLHVLHVARLGELFDSDVPRDESRLALVLVHERHPLRHHDDRLVDFALSLPCRVEVVFHLSMEGPLMKLFMPKWLPDMLRKAGMKDHELIESRMVSRKLVSVQKKIASEATGDEPADSFREWVRKNAPKQANVLDAKTN